MKLFAFLFALLSVPVFAQSTAPLVACGPGFPESCVTDGSIQDAFNGAQSHGFVGTDGFDPSRQIYSQEIGGGYLSSGEAPLVAPESTSPVVACELGFSESCVGDVPDDTGRIVVLPAGTQCGYEDGYGDQLVCHMPLPVASPKPDTDYEPPAQDQGDNLNAMADPE